MTTVSVSVCLVIVSRNLPKSVGGGGKCSGLGVVSGSVGAGIVGMLGSSGLILTSVGWL